MFPAIARADGFSLVVPMDAVPAIGPGEGGRLTKGNNLAPIPGTKRVARVEANVAADDVALTTKQIAILDGLPVAAGDHHNEAQMRLLERKSS